MAKQRGILTLEGTIGGLNFYIRKGKPMARGAGGGFTKEAIKTKPTMVRVRENNSEFGNSSKIKKEFRLALHPFLKNYTDVTLHGRMMQLFQAIKDCDTSSIRGSREVGKGILSEAGMQLFKAFRYTPKCDVRNVVPMKSTYDALSCRFNIVGFDSKLVEYPKSATHLELKFGVLGIDFETRYFKMNLAAPLLIEKEMGLLDFSMVPEDLPGEGLVRYAFLGASFYQEVNGVLYALKEDGTIGLIFVG